MLPHFEKMLYDQAMISIAYLEAYLATGRELYAKTAREIFTFVSRAMTDPGGGFYSAWDADSQGQEGRFYTWTIDQVRQVLDQDESELAIRYFNLKKNGNFTGEAGGNHAGANVLHTDTSVEELARRYDLVPRELSTRLEGIRQKLFRAREQRVHPHLDDKILTDWNGLMIGALAIGYRVLGDPELLLRAGNAADFILDRMADKEGNLLHRFRRGDSAVKGFLDDYAFLSFGLIELYQASFQPNFLKRAKQITRRMMELFSDKNGALYVSRAEQSSLPARTVDVYDGAIPSGASVAFYNLLRVGRITGDLSLEEEAEKVRKYFSSPVARQPGAHGFFLNALEFFLGDRMELVLSGNEASGGGGGVQKGSGPGVLPGYGHPFPLLRNSRGTAASGAFRSVDETGKREGYCLPLPESHLPDTCDRSPGIRGNVEKNSNAGETIFHGRYLNYRRNEHGNCN